jgi:hypothetical protein
MKRNLKPTPLYLVQYFATILSFCLLNGLMNISEGNAKIFFTAQTPTLISLWPHIRVHWKYNQIKAGINAPSTPQITFDFIGYFLNYWHLNKCHFSVTSFIVNNLSKIKIMEVKIESLFHKMIQQFHHTSEKIL